MINKSDLKEALSGVKKRKFKREYCEKACHQFEECDVEDGIDVCMELDDYELALKMYDDVDCTREEFNEVMDELQKEKTLEEEAKKVRKKMR